MGLVATLMAFNDIIADMLGVGEDDGSRRNFFCTEFTVDPDGSMEQRRTNCFALTLFSQNFWSDGDSTGWARSIQVGAVFGIFSVIQGFIAFVLLATASCFEIKGKHLMLLKFLQGSAAFFALMTLFSALVDVCKLSLGDNLSNLDCKRNRTRVGPGMGFMIAAMCLHLTALGLTMTSFCLEDGCDKANGKTGEAAPLAGDEEQPLENVSAEA